MQTAAGLVSVGLFQTTGQRILQIHWREWAQFSAVGVSRRIAADEGKPFFGRSRCNFVALTLLAADKCVGLIVANKRVGVRIEDKFAAQSQSDVDRVADRKHPMMRDDV